MAVAVEATGGPRRPPNHLKEVLPNQKIQTNGLDLVDESESQGFEVLEKSCSMASAALGRLTAALCGGATSACAAGPRRTLSVSAAALAQKREDLNQARARTPPPTRAQNIFALTCTLSLTHCTLHATLSLPQT
jgi:hypothetical protein